MECFIILYFIIFSHGFVLQFSEKKRDMLGKLVFFLGSRLAKMFHLHLSCIHIML